MSYGRFDCKASPQIFFDGPCFGWGFHNDQRLGHGSVTVPCVWMRIEPYSPTHSSPTSGKVAALARLRRRGNRVVGIARLRAVRPFLRPYSGAEELSLSVSTTHKKFARELAYQTTQ